MRWTMWTVAAFLAMTSIATPFWSLQPIGQETPPQALCDRANKALNAGDSTSAIKLYKESLRRRPDSIEATEDTGGYLRNPTKGRRKCRATRQEATYLIS